METSSKFVADVAIIGGGVGGCAAALALAESGTSVILTEEFRWLGGQLTSQAVPPDEHGWIEQFGCTASYREFRDRVRKYYRDFYPLIKNAKADPLLNPGNGWVSPICHEPKVALTVLQSMLAQHVSNGRIHIIHQIRPIQATMDGGDRIDSVLLTNTNDGSTIEIRAQFFLDATENGDLLPLANVEHVSGSESRADTAEPGAPEKSAPDNIQAFSVCFILDAAGNPATDLIEQPSDYFHWREHQPKMQPPWPGPLLSWQGLNPRSMERMTYGFSPHKEKPGLFSGLWSFRRIIDRSLFTAGHYPSDICLVNWPMIDYLEGHLLTDSQTEKNHHIARARSLSRSMVYWLQNEAPRPDGGSGWPDLRLRPDQTGTVDGLAMAPYIRESRRIRALYTVTEKDVSAQHRSNDTLAERYEDSVGIGYYRIDLHPSTGGDNYHDVASLPFRIPLRALVPVRVVNLIPAAKNIGTTHITNGCYRLHPVEWNIGEAAAMLAAQCCRDQVSPQQVAREPDRTATLQNTLRQRGVELAWPENLNLDDGDPHAHAR